jgi:uncharacterized protein YfaS (alpha-2-macroglobulin family)
MRFSRFFLVAVFLFCALFGERAPLAAETGEDAFRLVETEVQAIQEKPEICLVFNKPLSTDRAALAGALSLESDGEKTAVQARDLSLSGATLCLQQLDYRHVYKLRARNLRSEDGEALAAPVLVSLTIPDRKPELTFTPLFEKEGRFPIVANALKSGLHLHAVNVTATRLTLFRLTDRASYPAVWDQYAQLRLTAGESLAFAKQHGQQVGQGDLVFGDKPNAHQEIEVPLPIKDSLAPGLYFLIAESREDGPRGKEPQASLAAGSWFIVSDLVLSGARSPDGISVFAMSASARKPASNVNVALYGTGPSALREAKTDGNGVALLPPPAEQDSLASRLLAEDEAGNVAMVDLSRFAGSAFDTVGPPSLILPDRDLYKPNDVAQILLFARDASGRVEKTKAGSLKLLRPDQSFYAEEPVPAGKTGAFVMRFSLPVIHQAGVWTFLWQGEDGQVFGKVPVTIASGDGIPKIEIAADHAVMDKDGKTNLTIKVKDAEGRPMAWQEGEATVRLDRPVFAAFRAYRFGVAQGEAAAAPPVVLPFLTDADGVAHLGIEVPEAARDFARGLQITARTKQGGESDPLNVAVRNGDFWVGIRPLPDERPFAENSQALFDVIAVDANGKKRGSGDLYYQIFEEGRQFNWYQSEGQWDYKPLPEHRRIGGGRFALSASEENRIHWPVTAGHYVLEITNVSGSVLARYRFDAGNVPPSAVESVQDPRLSVTMPSGALLPAQEARLSVHLTEPAFVNIMIGDDHVRQTLQKAADAGDTQIAIMPREDWSPSLNARIEAVFANGTRAVLTRPLTLRHPQQEIDLALGAASGAGGSVVTVPVSFPKSGPKANILVSAVAATDDPTDETASAKNGVEAVAPDRAGRLLLHFDVPEQATSLRLSLVAWNETQHARKIVTIPIAAPLEVKASLPRLLRLGDQLSIPVSLTNKNAPDGNYAIALTVSDGLKIDGNGAAKLVLKKGQTRAVTIPVSPRKAGGANLQLDVTGPREIHITRRFDLRVMSTVEQIFDLKTEALAPQAQLKRAPKDEKASGDEAVLVSPVPLFEEPDFLSDFLKREPFTTTEIADWIEAARLWSPTIVGLGLESEKGMSDLMRQRRSLLAGRQNADGGFAALDGGESDLASTASALHESGADNLQASVLAARWLQKKLENTWFDEKEREARAAGFLALTDAAPEIRAAAGLGDPSGLRYFEETSRDKDLSLLTEARLAEALALVHDDETARFWLNKAQAGFPDLVKKDGDQAIKILPYLAAQPLLGIPDIVGLLTAAKPASLTPQSALSYLRATGIAIARVGSWHLAEKGADKKQFGILLLKEPRRVLEDGIQNLSRDPLYGCEIKPEKESAEKENLFAAGAPVYSIQRQFYGLDGARLGPEAPFEISKPTLLVLHGTLRDGAELPREPLALILPSSAFQPLISVSAPIVAALWPWISEPRTMPQNTMISEGALGFQIAPAAEWRVAILMQPTDFGSFALPDLRVRTLSGEPVPVTQNALRLRIQ